MRRIAFSTNGFPVYWKCDERWEWADKPLVRNDSGNRLWAGEDGLQPFGVLERINRNEDMRRLRELVREHGVKQIVVGLPLRLDGTRGQMAEEAERFARRVQKQIGVPVEMVDERLTSWEAERLLEETQGRFLHAEKSGAGRKKINAPAKATVDAMAAAVVLKEYLERQRQPVARD